jgi:hypothetical protein
VFKEANYISKKGLENMKTSLMNNEYLKEINPAGK